MDPVRLALTLAVAAALGGCGFDAAVPAGAVVLCASDRACPPSASHCDLAAHVCTQPGQFVDVTGPALVSAALAPASAGDGASVSLVLDADEPLAADAPPVLTFAGGVADPGFTVVDRPTPTSLKLGLTVSPDLAEGFYTLRTVTLVDDAGHGATSNVDGAALHVDRTPPIIAAVELSGHTEGGALVVSDQPGSNQLTARVLTSEELDLDVSTVSLGGAPLPCAALDGALGMVCSGVVDDFVLDGTNVVTAHAVDLAGNAADAQRSVLVDRAAPSIVAGTAGLTVNGRTSAEASPGDHLVLRFLVDEPLGAPPEVRIDSSQNFAFSLDAQDGQLYTLSLDVGAVVDEGVHPIVATLVDRFGHTASDVVVPLPAPNDAGLGLVAFAQSPCPDSGLCPDVDGDGFFGASPACAPGLATDCDDGDPLVHPGAAEIPGDGRRDDCTLGPDAPIDDSDGVFVAPDGDDANDGSAALPVRSLDAALGLVDAAHPYLFLAEGSYDLGDDDIRAPLVGGLHRATWTPGGQRSVLANPAGGVPDFFAGTAPGGRPLVAHVDIDPVNTIVLHDGGTVVDVSAGDVVSDGVLFLVEAETIDAAVHGGGDGSRILRSNVADVVVDANDVLVDRSVINGAFILNQGASGAVVNSALFGDGVDGLAFICAQCASGVLANDSFVTAPDSDVAELFTEDTPTPPVLVLTGDVFAPATDATLIETTSVADIYVRDNVFSWVGGVLYARDDTGELLFNDAEDFATFEACGWEGCNNTGDQLGSVAFAPNDPLHLGGDPALSDAFGNGESDFTLLPPGTAPASAVADVDGACRFDPPGRTNAGPDG